MPIQECSGQVSLGGHRGFGNIGLTHQWTATQQQYRYILPGTILFDHHVIVVVPLIQRRQFWNSINTLKVRTSPATPSTRSSPII